MWCLLMSHDYRRASSRLPNADIPFDFQSAQSTLEFLQWPSDYKSGRAESLGIMVTQLRIPQNTPYITMIWYRGVKEGPQLGPSMMALFLSSRWQKLCLRNVPEYTPLAGQYYLSCSKFPTQNSNAIISLVSPTTKHAKLLDIETRKTSGHRNTWNTQRGAYFLGEEGLPWK